MDTPDEGEGVQQDIVSESRVFLVNVEEVGPFLSLVLVIAFYTVACAGFPPWFRK